ncbi:uncharacterized protein K02A2.6-like [Carya illinoinensis]|uniref:uncharacterized protein K02A2.6-like n=1 Tax=Carya illinoinensis TaxID=32201 RepID=UPI001C723166|nr:uncharacterized protein K02A2.6-like [Carya illinoinensis]
MEGEALVWYQESFEKGHFHDWDTLTRSMLLRFGPTSYDSPMEALTRLEQSNSIAAYTTQFEALANRLRGLSDEHKLCCFISGLKDEIRLPIKMFNPVNMNAAYGLARLQEEYLLSVKKSIKQTGEKSSETFGGFSRGSYSGNSNTKWSGPTGATRPIISDQMDEKQKRGLCYHCNEKWNLLHNCKKSRIYFIQADKKDVEEEEDSPTKDEEEVGVGNKADNKVEVPEISLAAIAGTPTVSTMRLVGSIKGEKLVILVDSGSSYNFIDSTLIPKLKLVVDPSVALSVKVANGQCLSSAGMCNAVKVKMQGTSFKTSLYLLDLAGCDVVLGVQWLETLGPITWDFSKLLMSFRQEGKLIELQGLRLKPSVVEDGHKMPKGKGVLLQIMAVTEGGKEQIKLEADVTQVLEEFQGVFNEPKGLPPPRNHDHQIVLKEGTQPTANRPYRYPYYQKTEIEKIVAKLLKLGVVRPSSSPFSSPVLLVRKADGSWRLCVDYRALNKETVKAKFPIPVIDELLDELFGSVIFSKLDLRSGYHQVRVVEEDIPKTAFRTHEGQYEFLVMPFGLTNAPATFQGLMNDVFKPYLRKFVLVFFDDILVYSKSRAEHLGHLSKVLSLLQQHSLYAKRSKCKFAVGEIDYLGHVINANGVMADATKVAAMLEWPEPKNVKSLREFLGLTGYYRKFIRNYGSIAGPLTDLLKKNAFSWSEETRKAFKALKQAVAHPPVLRLPDFSKPFVIECDASGMGLGAVLMQSG